MGSGEFGGGETLSRQAVVLEINGGIGVVEWSGKTERRRRLIRFNS